MGILIGAGVFTTLIIVLNVALSYKFRGKTFPECDKSYRESAKLRENRHSFIYGLDDDNRRVKMPASEDIAFWQEKYIEVYNDLLKECSRAKGKHVHGRLLPDDIRPLFESMKRYRETTSGILGIEYGSRRNVEGFTFGEECYIISDDKDFIFRLYNAWYRCRKALKRDAREYAFHTHEDPVFSVNPYGLYKKFTDLERYMLEKGWNPSFVYALNKITYPIIKHIREPFPVIDKSITLDGARVTGMSGPVPDPRK